MESWTCPLCRQPINGKFSVNNHLRNIWKKKDDPTRCDFLLRNAPANETTVATVPLIPAAVITQPIPPRVSLVDLARRDPLNINSQRQMRQTYTIHRPLRGGLTVTQTDGCRDFLHIQHLWDRYRAGVRQVASRQFWKFFLPLHTLSGTAIDSALGNAKKVFLTPQTEPWRQFPSSRRALFDKIKRKVPPFWTHCMHTFRIDLEKFDLPGDTKSLDFVFIDPLWGWIMAARRQHPLDMHWKPVIQGGQTPLYGGGVQFGKCFQEADRTISPTSYVMAISLHWDGTSAHRGLASTPICIGVANCNNLDLSTQFCLGYVPKVPGDSSSFRKTSLSTEVKFYIRQECIGAILRVMETAAEKGITCRLRNQLGVEVERVLVPRLFAMNLDQPEAQLFFGMLNRTSCSKCIWRKGYSAFRWCSPQNRDAVLRLYCMAHNGTRTRAAQEKLRRWGFNPQRKCCLLTSCNKLLVRIPGLNEVFPCVDYRDRMHGMTMFLHRSMMETLDGLSTRIINGAARRTLDLRLKFICLQRFFRDPVTKRGFRVQDSIFSDVGMTASDKVCSLFLLPHVLGPKADIFPENVRAPLLTAVSHTQLILIAASGKRMYTVAELQQIFDRGYKLVLGSLQTIRRIDYDTRLAHHTRYPDRVKAPMPHKRSCR